MDGEIKNLDNLTVTDVGNNADLTQEVYSDTARGLEDLMHKFSYYKQVMGLFKEGEGKVELRKRFMLKMIDKKWVQIIEDTIPSLDVIIRNPGRLLQEFEELRPIEQTRKVTSRSIQHLAQHTDFINEIRDDGTVMPAKLLNVFQDETVLTYENRFINTLINRLYAFVCLRVDAAEECGTDEKLSTLSFNQSFTDGEKKGNISLKIEFSEEPRENEVVKNYVYTSDLWKRVLRIRRLVTSYMDSDFAHAVGKNFVRPPVMRTNLLLKNVDFRQCLTLWEFLESYENLGYETLIQEDLENVDDVLIKDFYNTLAEQYLLFQKHVRNCFEFENTLDSRNPDEIIPVEIKDELDPVNPDEFSFKNKKPDGEPLFGDESEEEKINTAVRIALAADDLILEEELEEAEEFEEEVENELQPDVKSPYRYRYSFMSRLILAQNPTQDYYTEIKNYLLSFKKVKSRVSWNYDAFGIGRKKCARMNVKGKTLYLYLPIDPYSMDRKYHLIDVSEYKSLKDFPALLKIRSDRKVKYAKELIDLIMQSLGAEKLTDTPFIDYHVPYSTREEMLVMNPPLIKIVGANQIVDETNEAEGDAAATDVAVATEETSEGTETAQTTEEVTTEENKEEAAAEEQPAEETTEAAVTAEEEQPSEETAEENVVKEEQPSEETTEETENTQTTEEVATEETENTQTTQETTEEAIKVGEENAEEVATEENADNISEEEEDEYSEEFYGEESEYDEEYAYESDVSYDGNAETGKKTPARRKLKIRKKPRNKFNRQK